MKQFSQHHLQGAIAEFKLLVPLFLLQVQSIKEKKPGTPPPTVTTVTPSPPTVNKVVVSTPAPVNIPRFYFPKGLPSVSNNHEETIAKVEVAFAEFEDEKGDIYEMGKIAKVRSNKRIYFVNRCTVFPLDYTVICLIA